MTSTTVAPADAPWRARAWARPLGAHVAALVALLLALMPLLGTSRLFAVDEATIEAQTSLLAEGRGWLMDHPRPDLDPDGHRFPIDLVPMKGDQAAPFAKHPVYAVALTPFQAVGGKPAMVLTSLAGSVLAALAAALLARRLRPGLERPTLWVVGLASPMFLHSWLLIGHTMAAALAVSSVLLATGEQVTSRRLALIAVVVGLAVTLRSEALLFGVALALAALTVGWLRRDRSHLLVGAAALIGAAAGNLADSWLADLVVSGQGLANPTASRGSGDLIADRAYAFVVTWLLPSYDGIGVGELLLVAATILASGAVLVARRRPDDTDGIRLLAIAAGACAVVQLVLPAHPVPGLLPAFPVLAAGVVALRPRALTARPEALLATLTFGLFAVAVLATQYRDGGGGAWGGRYFLLGIPVIVPVALLALAEVGDRLDARTRQIALAAMAVGSLALTAGAARTLHERQWSGQHALEAIEAAVDASPDAVVVAADGPIGRRGWEHIVAGDEWLLSETDEDLTELGAALAADGRPIVLATVDEDAKVAALEEDYEVVERIRPESDTSRVVLTLQPR